MHLLQIGRRHEINATQLVFLIISEFLQHFPVTLKRGIQLLVLLFQQLHLPLCSVLLLFASFELGLSTFDLFLDVCEEQVLIERMNLANVIVLVLGGGLIDVGAVAASH